MQTEFVVDLGGKWKISNKDQTTQVHGKVPGNVHTALQEAGIIGDPYFRFNDDEYKWIQRDDWIYSREFVVNDVLQQYNNIDLVCHGLDTVATVTLNGQTIGCSDNQFVRYTFDIKDVIQVGTNIINIAFKSAVKYAKEEFEKYPQSVPPLGPPEEYHPEPHPNFIRKSQCSFAWDWGPSFVTQGIWRAIEIRGSNGAVITDIVPVTSRGDGGEWQLTIRTILRMPSGQSANGKLEINIPGLNLSKEFKVTDNEPASTFLVPEAEPWWPRGYGEAKLYNLCVSFIDDQKQWIHSKTTHVGFRTIEQIEEPLPNGLSFYLKINNVPVFLKGANWIPVDSFQDRISAERLHSLLEAAAEVNMNTVRVWGGGVYEQDEFYNMADKMGLIVWQDLMFACSMYPVHEKFLKSVRQEIRHQVQRLAAHPSIVIWTANNENESALVDNWYGTSGPEFERHKLDYIKLYVDTIHDEFLTHGTQQPFLVSSPSNASLTEKKGWISMDPKPSDPRYGTVHHYNYVDDGFDQTIFPRTRFAAEYGYQSWPAYETLNEVAKEGDLTYNSEFCNHRQHKKEAGDGTEQLLRRHFQWPESKNKEAEFQNFIYLTQITQAWAYKTQTEFYRRSRSDIHVNTMGAIYWQLNDIWQAPTWATIDYNGCWKMAHYYAKQFFADVAVSAFEADGIIHIYVINDKLINIAQAKLQLNLWTWNQSEPILTRTLKVDVPSAASKEVFTAMTSNLLEGGGNPGRETCFLTAQLDGLTSPTPVFFEYFNDALVLKNPELQVEAVVKTDFGFLVTITGVSPAAFVWLQANGIKGHFSDNGFLMTSKKHSVVFHTKEVITSEHLRETLSIKSLYNVYH